MLLFVIFLAATARAQDKRGISVFEVARPDYDALGIRVGAFLIKPELLLGLEYNDNIFATKHDKKSDTITILAPKLEIHSDWNRHALSMRAGVKSGIYSSESDENYLDGHIILDGRLDLLRESFFTGKAGFHHLHEARTDPDSKLAWKEPATYFRTNGDIGYYHGRGKLSASGGFGITRYDYQSVDLKTGGSQNLDIRDYNTYRITGRLAYEMRADVQPFIGMGYEWRRYDKSEAERDSQGYRVGVGTGFDLGGITSGEVFAGYMNQNYDEGEDISGPWYGISILWNVTEMTSVEGSVSKLIKETTLKGSSGIDSTETNLRLGHELLRNLLVNASFGYTYDSYKGVDISEKNYIFGPGLTYLWNRNLSAEISYKCNIVESNQLNREYTENKFLISLLGKF